MTKIHVTAIAFGTFALGVMIGRFSNDLANAIIFHFALAGAYGAFTVALLRR